MVGAGEVEGKDGAGGDIGKTEKGDDEVVTAKAGALVVELVHDDIGEVDRPRDRSKICSSSTCWVFSEVEK